MASIGPPADWASIEAFARAMKERQQRQLAKDPSSSSPQNPGAPEEPSNPRASGWPKRQKTANGAQVSSREQDYSPVESESSSLPSALDTVSGLKLMSLLQNMNLLTFEMISRRNNLQILKDLERDDLGGNDEEPAGANTSTTRALEAEGEAKSSKNDPSYAAALALMNL